MFYTCPLLFPGCVACRFVALHLSFYFVIVVFNKCVVLHVNVVFRVACCLSFSPLFLMVFVYFVASFSAVLLLFVADVRCLFCHLVVELEERRFLLWYAANDSKLKTENMSFC